MRRNYGALVPVDPRGSSRRRTGFTLELGAGRSSFLDTPGHARHHFCVWDEASRSMFTGDTFGLSYRELASGRGRVHPAHDHPRPVRARGAPRLDRPAGRLRARRRCCSPTTRGSPRSSGWPPTCGARSASSWRSGAAEDGKPDRAAPPARGRRASCCSAGWRPRHAAAGRARARAAVPRRRAQRPGARDLARSRPAIMGLDPATSRPGLRRGAAAPPGEGVA